MALLQEASEAQEKIIICGIVWVPALMEATHLLLTCGSRDFGLQCSIIGSNTH